MSQYFKKPYPELMTEIGEILLIGVLPILLFQSKIFAFFSAAPLLYAFFRFGKKHTFIIAIFSIVLASFIETQVSLKFFLLISPLPAFIFCAVSLKQKSIAPLFLASISLLMVSYAAVLLYLSKGEPYSYLQNVITEGLQTIPPWLEKNKGIIVNLKKTNPVQIETWVSGFHQLSENAPNVAQTFIQEKLFGYAVSALVLILWLFVIFLKSLGVTVTSTDLTRWKVPDHLVWLAIISYVFREISIPILSPVFKNIFIILEVIYFLHGLSIVAFFFKTRQVSSIQRNFFQALFILFPVITVSIGFFDLWLDFRSKIEKSQKKSVLDRNNVKGGA